MIKCINCGEENSSIAFKCKKCGKLLKREKGVLGTSILVAALAIDVACDIAGVVMDSVFPDDAGDVKVKDSKAGKPDVESTDDDSGKESETIYVASANAAKFHTPECRWAKKIDDSNKVTYSSRDEAIADGKTSCSVCNS